MRKLLLLVLFLSSGLVMSTQAFGRDNIKSPNVAGQFYSSNPKELTAHIDHFFTQAKIQPYDKKVDIVIAPHAGYVYSGGVAAFGFKASSQTQYTTIVVLAPSHHFPYDGISIWGEGGFETPLGVAEVDQGFAKALIAGDDQFYFKPKFFEREHALEVEIPFLQKTFQNFKIVPVLVGQPTFETMDRFAETLHKVIGEREDVLIVVSTDLSHYHDDGFARKMDARTIEAVTKFQSKQLYKECRARTMEMCGCMPVVASLLYAKRKGLQGVDVLKYANSGDVSGDKERVVGYTSIVIYDKKKIDRATGEGDLSDIQKKTLLKIARDTIEQYVRSGKKPKVKESDQRLFEKEGAFVTIKKHGQLRGCIGNIIGSGALCHLVSDMAVSSATKDPRFEPLHKEELDEIEVEVSVLSKPRVVKNTDEIVMGKHGVIVSKGPFHGGVFLPKVATETGWNKEEFMAQLCSQKAGLPRDCWKDPKTKIEIFTAQEFSEKDFQ